MSAPQAIPERANGASDRRGADAVFLVGLGATESGFATARGADRSSQGYLYVPAVLGCYTFEGRSLLESSVLRPLSRLGEASVCRFCVPRVSPAMPLQGVMAETLGDADAL